MGKSKKHQDDNGRYGKCEICLEHIPIEYYFNKGDEITCYECGTEYTIVSKEPVKLALIDGGYNMDDDYDEMMFD